MINEGVSVKVALLTFVLVFGAAMFVVLFLARVRQGWRAEARLRPADELPPALASGNG